MLKIIMTKTLFFSNEVKAQASNMHGRILAFRKSPCSPSSIKRQYFSPDKAAALGGTGKENSLFSTFIIRLSRGISYLDNPKLWIKFLDCLGPIPFIFCKYKEAPLSFSIASFSERFSLSSSSRSYICCHSLCTVSTACWIKTEILLVNLKP